MLTRRQLLLSTSAVPVLAADKKPVQRPNVLVVLADDLGSWMLGCYGNKEIQTPNIDMLARTGMRFVNSFCVAPICSASRATLFTGRVPRQHGIHDFLTDSPVDNPAQGQKQPPPAFAQETMISDVLAGQGYNCGYVGKWHMGGDTKPGHGIAYSYTMYGGSRSYTEPEMYQNGEKVQESGYLADIMTRKACDFLDQQQSDKPFFLTVGYLNPHLPYEGHPQKYYDMYAGSTFDSIGWEPAAKNALREKELLGDIVGNLRKNATAVTALDDQIPVLLRKLQQKGLFDNTLIVFTGDNGFLLGRHGLWSKGHASDPINMYEEAVGVPMIWSWPGKVPATSFAPQLISFYDFMPSICEATGSPIPAGRALCGRSYAPIAMRRPLPKDQPWRNLVFGHFRNTEMARDNRYKLVLRNEGAGPNELFDLTQDPREKVNVFENEQYINVRDGLTKEIAAWRKRTS